MAEREAVSGLDERWVLVRSGAVEVAPEERERLLDELIAALRAQPDDPGRTALLGLRLADRAALRFAEGDRASALGAIEESLRSSGRAAPYSAEFARWYARGLINHGVWLAWPLSDGDRLPRHPLGAAGSEGPTAMERAAGERARDLTRTAVEVWSGLDQEDPVNRRGLAQAKVFLGDRLAELGAAEEAVAWAVDAQEDFRRLLFSAPGAEEAQEAGEALDHLGRQLGLRLRFLSFDSLVSLRARGLLPEPLLPQAVVAARVRGADGSVIAARLGLGAGQVATMLEVTPWLAVWRIDVRTPDGLWKALDRPWRDTAEVRDRTAEEVAAGVVRAFRARADCPGEGGSWRIRLWWHEEGDPAGAAYRLFAGPDAPAGTPS
ncbi:hypothetical protein [Streptomyces sp. NPDC051567]|uniref:hypothetical protein n=1 Tax=Streptomyces sp. NPDC051567 TaxID=3365660 RepID=UPI00379588A1